MMNDRQRKSLLLGMAVGYGVDESYANAHDWTCDVELTDITEYCVAHDMSVKEAYAYAVECMNRNIIPTFGDGYKYVSDTSYDDCGCALGSSSKLGYPTAENIKTALSVVHAYMHNYNYAYIQEFYNDWVDGNVVENLENTLEGSTTDHKEDEAFAECKHHEECDADGRYEPCDDRVQKLAKTRGSVYDRTRAAVYATGNKWAIENFEATHS